MKCINCGHEIAENSTFCTFCGSPVSPAKQTETPVSAVHKKYLMFSRINFSLLYAFW